jgi:hypothetical protein
MQCHQSVPVSPQSYVVNGNLLDQLAAFHRDLNLRGHVNQNNHTPAKHPNTHPAKHPSTHPFTHPNIGEACPYLCLEVLDDDICHVLTKGIQALVERVDRGKHHLVEGDGTCPTRDVRDWTRLVMSNRRLAMPREGPRDLDAPSWQPTAT